MLSTGPLPVFPALPVSIAGFGSGSSCDSRSQAPGYETISWYSVALMFRPLMRPVSEATPRSPNPVVPGFAPFEAPLGWLD